MEKQKNLIKLSNLLLDSLNELKRARLQQIQAVMDDFSVKCSEATKDSRLFSTAVEKGWLIGAEDVRSRVSRNLNDFSYYLQRFKELVNEDETAVPNFSDIFAELLQAEQEFGEVKFDSNEKTLSITTEPITLEDISFGPFEIKLFVSQLYRLYSDSPYRVIALEPNPAGNDSDVTHPHVSAERLCEGDGHVAIRKSIEQGRLCDFFTMAINILQTYNPDSPYVALDEWEGRACYDCGCTIFDDESYYCERCDRDYCSQCSTCCRVCDTTVCLGCSCECQGCNEPVCRDCADTCKVCEETFCKNCLTEDGLCENCESERKENENEERDECSEKPKADAEVQSDSMGETSIHA
jgi:hypothetical protein